MEEVIRVTFGLIAAAIMVYLLLRVIRSERLEGGETFTSSAPLPREDEDETLVEHRVLWDRTHDAAKRERHDQDQENG